MPNRPVRELLDGQALTTATPDTTVGAASRLMKMARVGALLVVEEGNVAGIFTERDAVFRVLADGLDPDKTRLADVMTVNPETISSDKPFIHALHMMHDGGFRHVPVVQDGRPIGMVSARDALAPDLREFVGDLDDREHIGEILG